MMFRRCTVTLAIGFASLSLTPAVLRGQQADIIRGRVTGPDGRPVPDARVTGTSIPANVTRAATTDRNGRYSLVFATGEGDYWISVSAIGFAPRRFELKRLADESVLIGDMRLSPIGTVLDAVRVQASRTLAGRNDPAPDVSGTEKSVGAAAVDPAQAGNLAAIAASAPGVQLIPGADGAADQFSVFGLGGDQNRTTLNGLAFGGNDIPRDASTRLSLGTSPWDVSRGGFSGAQMGMTTRAGSNFNTRGMSTLLNSPSTQWIDGAGRSLGAAYGSASLGAATAGAISLDKSFYSGAIQFDRRESNLPALLTADPLALQLAGVAADSVARFGEILARVGAPMTGPRALPRARVSERGLLLANFDWAPPTSTTGQAVTLTAATTFVNMNAPFAQLTALPTNDASTTSWLGAIQGRQTFYLPSGILSETSAGINQQRASTSPYLEMPAAGVQVNSVLEDGSSAIAGLTFAGSQIQRTRSAQTTAVLQNQLSWFSLNSRHRLQLTTMLRYDSFEQDVTANALGTFFFNSLADLEAGRPAVFTRTLAPQLRRGGQLLGSLALGDAFRVRPDFQLQYGVRVDANRFLQAPAANTALEAALGVDNARVPNRIYVSPRIGFSWMYGEAPQVAIADGFVRGPRAVVRGGIGVFQNTPTAQVSSSALSNTGLAGSSSRLMCVGAAAPRPAWWADAGGGYVSPSASADGSTGTAFASQTPEVWLFDRAYRAQRSVRANTNWSGAIAGNRLVATIDATYSMNLRQVGAVNANFDGTPRFRLESEGNRPVFAAATSVVPSTGAVAAIDARLAPAFGPVMQQRSDLESRNLQLSVSVQPTVFSSRLAWNAAYVYSATREAAWGFSSTAGDPREREWARGAFDSRHQIALGLSYNILDWVPVSLNASFRSGRPFTPLVATDINGDGARNDRAFVFDPAMANDAAVAAGMRTLLQTGSSAARACLARQLGQLAGRASCEEPWSSTSTLTIGLNPLKFGFPQRLNLSLYVNNPFGAADLILNGESGRRGWGQAISIDQTLLYTRGFDPVAKRFRYEVNPRFGSTNPRATVNRNPVVVTVQARLDIGLTRERQLLTQSLDRGRSRAGNRATDQDIRGMSTTLIPPNPLMLILRQADSLKLTRRQADSLSSMNRAYALAYDSIWNPVARYLSGLPAVYDRAEAYERYRVARERTIDRLIALAPAIRGMMNSAQLRALPSTAQTSLDRRYLASVRSSTAGGANMGALGLLAQLGWTGGTVDPSATAVMIHR